MGYKHSRDDILSAACDVALESGMSGLTFGAVGLRGARFFCAGETRSQVLLGVFLRIERHLACDTVEVDDVDDGLAALDRPEHGL